MQKSKKTKQEKKFQFARNDTTDPQWPRKTTVCKCIVTPLQRNDKYRHV